MKPLTARSSADPQDLLGYEVVDRHGNRVGIVQGRWADPATGTLTFLGVTTGELAVGNHLVPVESAEVDEGGRIVRVPFDAGLIGAAPGLDTGAALLPEREKEVLHHYASPGNATTGAATTAGVGTSGSRTGGEAVELVLAEEQLKITKRTVPAGFVRVRKIIVTEQVQVPVEVRREDVVIERVEAGDAMGADVVPFDGKTFEIVLHEERVVVSKEIHVSGAVRVRRTVQIEGETLRETVRHQDVEVLRAGESGDWRQDAPLASSAVGGPTHLHQTELPSSPNPLAAVDPTASLGAATNAGAVPEAAPETGKGSSSGTGRV
ncbi:MAG TPA: PRC and DUF2382 domain-containing protein [Chthoniobacterales bacterium]